MTGKARSNSVSCHGVDFKQRCLQQRLRNLAAHFRASFFQKHPALRNRRAQGMPGGRSARSLACKMRKHTSIVTTVTPVSPGIPYAMVLTACFVLSPVTGLSCHRRLRNFFRQLDASVGASGPHDFAVRIRRVRLARHLRPPHPAAHVRDDRETPLEMRRDRIAIVLFLHGRQAGFGKSEVMPPPWPIVSMPPWACLRSRCDREACRDRAWRPGYRSRSAD
jgi:hypothetical protein